MFNNFFVIAVHWECGIEDHGLEIAKLVAEGPDIDLGVIGEVLLPYLGQVMALEVEDEGHAPRVRVPDGIHYRKLVLCPEIGAEVKVGASIVSFSLCHLILSCPCMDRRASLPYSSVKNGTQ